MQSDHEQTSIKTYTKQSHFKSVDEKYIPETKQTISTHQLH